MRLDIYDIRAIFRRRGQHVHVNGGRHHLAELVIGVVAADLCPAGGRPDAGLLLTEQGMKLLTQRFDSRFHVVLLFIH